MKYKSLKTAWNLLFWMVVIMDTVVLIYEDGKYLSFQLIVKALVCGVIWHRAINRGKWKILLFPMISIPLMCLFGLIEVAGCELHIFLMVLYGMLPIYTLYGAFLYINYKLMITNKRG